MQTHEELIQPFKDRDTACGGAQPVWMNPEVVSFNTSVPFKIKSYYPYKHAKHGDCGFVLVTNDDEEDTVPIGNLRMAPWNDRQKAHLYMEEGQCVCHLHGYSDIWGCPVHKKEAAE